MSGAMVARDTDRAAVYAAEDQWTAAIDRGGPIDFFGSRLQLPVQTRFGSLPAVERYVEHLIAMHPGVPAVSVRHRRGNARAHYSAGVIAIPMTAPWACRESVVLHEFAHHLNALSIEPAHGPRFRARLVALVERAQAPESALLLRRCFESKGLEVPAHVD
jgi:putative metallohydrolase (TIGR04338 family)